MSPQAFGSGREGPRREERKILLSGQPVQRPSADDLGNDLFLPPHADRDAGGRVPEGIEGEGAAAGAPLINRCGDVAVLQHFTGNGDGPSVDRYAQASDAPIVTPS